METTSANHGSRFPEDSFSKRLINEQLELKLSPKEIASLTGNLIGGGVDTTTTTILVFIFAMCAFPRVQTKAQEEIDRVLAAEPRPPTWEDEESLPYCRALLTEIFRWRSAIALGGPPHAPTQDDVYNGMLIPAGTTIIGNLWAIHPPRPLPFNVEFAPRSEKIEEIIRQEASRAELELRKYDIASKVTLDNN
ncbi:hypothetical protein K4K59_002188 [Colletotrichum sp. SAR11_240]|nr:hypothetical protein K4K59_002188 [Colletotrichum sp. SAR11_240]